MNYEEEIIEITKKVATLEADVHNLCGWQGKQNGSLQRMEEKVEAILISVTKAHAKSLAVNILSPVVVGLIVFLVTRG